jgi:Protein of unknown function (DUF2971)
MKLYKYVSPDIVDKAFSMAGKCTLRCSYPNDFNDPYELFLTIDYNQRPDVLAFYRETIGKIPQYPTTCFSKSPDVVPMWAHYAFNHQGFVIEIEEEKLSAAFPEVRIEGIDYRDTPNEQIAEFLYRANVTCKPRHIYFLQEAVINAAYFTKSTLWSYEQEVRMVAHDDDVDNINGLMFSRIPVECVTALIVGHKATDKNKLDIAAISEQLGCSYYEMIVGRSSSKPYFISPNQTVHSFVDGVITTTDNICKICKEPITKEHTHCPWCSVSQSHEVKAAERNSFRRLSELGMLDKYCKDMEQISKRSRK